MEELLQKFLLSQSDNTFLIETLKQRINELEARVPSNDLILENANNNTLVLVLKARIKELEEKDASNNSNNNALVMVLKDRIKELEEKDAANNSLVVENANNNTLVMFLKDKIKELEEKGQSNNSLVVENAHLKQQNVLLSTQLLNPPSSIKPVVKQMTLAEALLEEGIAQYRGELIDALIPPKQRDRLRQSDFNPKAHTSLRAYCNSAANILGKRIYAPGTIKSRHCAKRSFIRFLSLTDEDVSTINLIPPETVLLCGWIGFLAEEGKKFNTICNYSRSYLCFCRDYCGLNTTSELPGLEIKKITSTLHNCLMVYGNDEKQSPTFTDIEFIIVMKACSKWNDYRKFRNCALLAVSYAIGQRPDSVTFMRLKDVKISINDDSSILVIYETRKMKTVLARPHRQPLRSKINASRIIDPNTLLIEYLITRNVLLNFPNTSSLDKVLSARGEILVKPECLDEYLFPRSHNTTKKLIPNSRMSTQTVSINYRTMFSFAGLSLGVTSYSPRRSMVTNSMKSHRAKGTYDRGIEETVEWVGWQFSSKTIRTYVGDDIRESMEVTEMLGIGAQEDFSDDESDVTSLYGDDDDDHDDNDDKGIKDDDQDNDQDNNDIKDDSAVQDIKDIDVQDNEEEEEDDTQEDDQPTNISPDLLKINNDVTNLKETLFELQEDIVEIKSILIQDDFPKQVLDVKFSLYLESLLKTKLSSDEESYFTKISRDTIQTFLTFLFKKNLRLEILYQRQLKKYQKIGNSLRRNLKLFYFNEYVVHDNWREIFQEDAKEYFDKSFEQDFYTHDRPTDVFRTHVRFPKQLYDKIIEASGEDKSDVQLIVSEDSIALTELQAKSVSAIILRFARTYTSSSTLATARFSKIMPKDMTDSYKDKALLMLICKEYYSKGDSIIGNYSQTTKTLNEWCSFSVPSICTKAKPYPNKMLVAGYEEKFLSKGTAKKPARYFKLQVLPDCNCKIEVFEFENNKMQLKETSKEAPFTTALTSVGVYKNKQLQVETKVVRAQIEALDGIEQYYQAYGQIYTPLTALVELEWREKFKKITTANLKRLCNDINLNFTSVITTDSNLSGADRNKIINLLLLQKVETFAEAYDKYLKLETQASRDYKNDHNAKKKKKSDKSILKSVQTENESDKKKKTSRESVKTPKNKSTKRKKDADSNVESEKKKKKTSKKK